MSQITQQKLTINANVNGNVTGDLTATNGTFSGDVTVGGTLTYDDVTNIDSVGVITARAGVNVTGGSVGIGTTNPSVISIHIIPQTILLQNLRVGIQVLI